MVKVESFAVQRLKRALKLLPERASSVPDLTDENVSNSSSGAFTFDGGASEIIHNSYIAFIERELISLKKEFESLKCKTSEALLDNDVLRKKLAECTILALIKGGDDFIDQELQATETAFPCDHLHEDLEIAQKEITKLNSIIKQKDSEIKLLQFCGQQSCANCKKDKDAFQHLTVEIEKKNISLQADLAKALKELLEFKAQESDLKCQIQSLQLVIGEKTSEIGKLQQVVHDLDCQLNINNQQISKPNINNPNQTLLDGLQNKFDVARRELETDILSKQNIIMNLDRQLRESTLKNDNLTVRIREVEDLLQETQADAKLSFDAVRAELQEERYARQMEHEELLSVKLNKNKECRELKREVQKLEAELSLSRERLLLNDADILTSNEHVLTLASKLAEVERENSLLRLKPDLDAHRELRVQEELMKPRREQEARLLQIFDSMESKHLETMVQLKKLIDVQSDIIQNLKPQCYELMSKLEEMSACYIEDKGRLEIEMETYATECNGLQRAKERLEKQLGENNLLLKKTSMEYEALKNKTVKQEMRVVSMTAELTQHKHQRQILEQQVFLLKQLLPEFQES